MPRKTYPDLVLAVAPTTRGFAFVLFEGPLAPFDWGLKDIRAKQKNARVLEAVRVIIEQYHPTVLILPNCKPKDAHRSPRVRALALALRHLGETNQMMVHQFDRAAIRQCFASVGARTKHEIALVIAEEIPAFRHRLPPIRKIWMREDARQSLFDAAALGLAYYGTGKSASDP